MQESCNKENTGILKMQFWRYGQIFYSILRGLLALYVCWSVYQGERQESICIPNMLHSAIFTQLRLNMLNGEDLAQHPTKCKIYRIHKEYLTFQLN